MSVASTRSGRVVKMKHNTDAENTDRSTDNGTKSLSTTSTKKGRPPKRISMEEKSPKNDDALKNQQSVIKDAPVKKSPLPSSPVRGRAAKPGNEVISEAAAPAKTKLSSTVAEVRETERVSLTASAAVKEGSGRETTTSSPAVRRSGRAPVPSSRFKDMELDLSKSKKRSYISMEDSEAELERVKKSKKTSDHSAVNIEDVVNKSSHITNTDEASDVNSAAVVLEDGNVPLSIEDMIQSNLSAADINKEKENVKNISLESMETQVTDVSEHSTLEQNSSSRSIHAAELSVDAASELTPAFPNIRIGGQQLTFTERDGETVAVVTIAASSFKEVTQENLTLDSSTQEEGMTFETVDSEKEKKTFSELVTVSPTVHSLGHVIKRELLEAPFATVVGQDGATYLNLSVEATKISSILKGKHVTTAVKSSNPLKGHGRVLRNPAGSMIMKTTLVPPRLSQQEVPETKPSVTYSLLCPQKPQVGESTNSAPKTLALPASVKSSQVHQSSQGIVIRQQTPQNTSLLTSVSQPTATSPNENMLTVINFSQELPTKNTKASSYFTDDSNKAASAMPKTASEILLQRVKLQSELAVLKESSEAVEAVAQEPTSNADAYDVEISGTVDEIQTSQQLTSESADHLGISSLSHDGNSGVVEESQHGSPLNIEDKITPVSSCGNIQVITVRVDTQDNSLSKDLNDDALCESSHTVHEEGVATVSLGQTTAQDITESTDTSGDNIVMTRAVSPEMPTSPSTHLVLKKSDTKEMQTSISADNLSMTVESEGIDQNAMTKIVTLDGNLSNLTSACVSKDKNKCIEKITVVDNGVEYDVRIVSEEEVAEEIIDNAASQILQIKESASDTAEVETEIKQECDAEDIKPEVEKQTSGTQTVYSPKVQSTNVAGTNTTTTHTLTTVVEEGSEKKHVYYVSVIPNKGIMAKTKTSMYSSAASWVIDDNGMYCCEKCDYQTDRKANFYKHRRSHTGAKPHVCPVCLYKAGTSSNLKRHMGIHKDIREHKCDICGLCFRQKIHLERHVKYKHEEKSIKCPMCDYICANEQPDLKMHIKRKHSTENSGEMVTCPECNIQVGNRKDLKQHLKFHKDGPELKLFCKDCSFVTDCQSRLKRHTAIHSKMKPFQCGVCNYRAAQKEHVLRHLRTQHKIDIKREGKRPWRRHKKGSCEDRSKERADFTSGDKIFACNHCTMRFAKLINLYKHLHTQHIDIMPAETDGNFYCVVCEFSTTNKKNLLVHMRRHNMTDQTPPTHVYSCVLCPYVNPRRRNLFQHMRKKHNISISQQTESAEGEEDGEGQDMEVSEIIGSVNKALTPSSNTVSVTTTEASESSSREMIGDLTSVASVIKIEDSTRMSTSGENDDMQALVIDSRDADVAEVVHTTTHAAEALEGLQALAEQAGLIDNIIEEQVPVLDEQQTIVIEQNGSTTEVVGTVEAIGGQLQHIIQTAETLTSTNGEAADRLELSEDQLSSLRNGDMVEMEGHLYLVELAQDPNSPHKQVLSFLPVTTASITQDSNG